jgi:hypothetical protein
MNESNKLILRSTHHNEWDLHLPELNHRIQNENFYSFLENQYVTEDEFFNSLYLSETIFVANDRISEYEWIIKFKSHELGKIMFYSINYPKVNDLFDYHEVENMDSQLVDRLQSELTKYQKYLYIGNLYIDVKFRRIGIMNYFVSTLLNIYENINYIGLIHYATMGEDTVDDLLLKRCYQSYGFRPDIFWQTVHKSTNLLIRTNDDF